MKQATHKIDNIEYIFVEVENNPTQWQFTKVDKDDLFDVDDIPYSVVRYQTSPHDFHAIEIQESESFIELMDYKIISTLSNISEKECKKLVQQVTYNSWLNYIDWSSDRKTAKESLQSLITSLGLSGEVLILLKQN